MSDLRLFNTLTRKQEVFTPLEPGHAKMYCCGPTVYNVVHIGNLRTFLWADLLRRFLEWKGMKVTMVMNVTDIEDKIIRDAAKAGVDIFTFTAPYTQVFFENLDLLRIRRADLYPKATDHIPEMVDIVRKLEARGHTYEADGSTYFRISTLPGYGKLSQVELAPESSLSRVENDEYEKDDARDFVLWKAKKEGEPSWQTELGDGRPGWHIECSAMSMKYLGETFDLHTGAVDLIFPHHENEIAQSEGATGNPFVRFWIHGEHLVVEDAKMSKSAGNFFTLPDLVAQGNSALEIRYALLAVPHRTKLNFTKHSLEDAKSALARIDSFAIRLDELAKASDDRTAVRGAELAQRFLRDFEDGLDDDLNTAAALGALFMMIREANTAADRGELAPADAIVLRAALDRADLVLDIVRRDALALDADIEAMIQARADARQRRDFKESDRLRDELLAAGIILEDTPQGVRWRRK
ncbi:MAG: cysteine--tRNA ligase [Thermoanaerobaculia bacterium]